MHTVGAFASARYELPKVELLSLQRLATQRTHREPKTKNPLILPDQGASYFGGEGVIPMLFHRIPRNSTNPLHNNNLVEISFRSDPLGIAGIQEYFDSQFVSQ